MAAGSRSLLAFWAGGAGSVTPTTTGGVRSLLAPWMGGASAPPAATTTGGVRSLLAFWIGGGTAGVAPEPPPVPPAPPRQDSAGRGGGWGNTGWTSNRRSIAPSGYDNTAIADQKRRRDEDDLMLQIIIQAVTRGML